MFLILIVTLSIRSRTNHTKRHKFLFGCRVSAASFHIFFDQFRNVKMKFPCNISEKTVASNHNAICCDTCNKWMHTFCNNISTYCYRKLQKDSAPWYCKNCLKQVMSFNKLTDYQLKALTLGKILTSPKLLSTNDYLLFADEECENAAKTELMTP